MVDDEGLKIITSPKL